jgi:predicted metal-dependent HD superfamily phosphohydrolase
MRERWKKYCSRIGAASEADAWFDIIDGLHAAPPRAYHNLSHVGECLDLLGRHRSGVNAPDVLELALWFHDCIYVPGRSDNEARSAAIGAMAARALGLGERTSNRISALILATRHASLPTTEDEAILLDIDLSILAAGDARYDRYAAQIRAEHEFVKDAEFAAGRAKFLRSMLKRPRLFHSSLLGSALEPRARANVAAEISRLEEQQLKV